NPQWQIYPPTYPGFSLAYTTKANPQSQLSTTSTFTSDNLIQIIDEIFKRMNDLIDKMN
ncbi:117_t:CDS:1, partial [Dentiscutata erythropus]